MITLGGVNISLFLSWFLFEFHVAEVHYARGYFVDAHFLLSSKAENIKCRL